ncbi:hypothetical protein [Pseudoflavitalea rhizosphaerae]|nr:hypothetical protein [Pseudoflavitalea rhizosphaerae]
MKPLFLLIISFFLGILIAYILKGDPHLIFNGNLSMALMFCSWLPG